MNAEADKRQIGPFQLESKLGAGGMGIVYCATYLKTGQKAAVKVLSPDLTADERVAKRFEREMAILKKLQHPHIIKYFGGSASRSQRFYAMELLSGGSVEQLLKQSGRLTWQQTVEYGIQIAKALEHAHNAGVIHRDLKPANLLLTKKGLLKLTDFGIARDTQATQITAAGKTVGTMAYMAPEQITGKHPISRKTDLYALGCVLFELLTGRTPFQSETQPELLFKHVDEEPPSVREFNPDVPRWLDELIDELLAKEPEDRPFDALAVQVQLEEVRQKVAEQEQMIRQTAADGGSALTQHDPTVDQLLGRSKKPRKKRRKRRDQAPFYEQTWFLAAGLAVIIAIVAFALWPEGEEKIYARAAPLMESNDSEDWFEAQGDLEKLVAKYPEGAHADEARGWLDDIELERQIRRLTNRLDRRGFVPETEAQQLYVDAREYERFGDRFAALDVYDSMEQLLAGSDDIELRALLTMARRDRDRIQEGGDASVNRTDFIREQLDAADALYRDGKRVEARDKWVSIVRLYKGKPQFAAFVAQASQRLDDPEAALQSQDAPPQ